MPPHEAWNPHGANPRWNPRQQLFDSPRNPEPEDTTTDLERQAVDIQHRNAQRNNLDYDLASLYPCQICLRDQTPTVFVTWFWGDWRFILCQVCHLLAQIGQLASRIPDLRGHRGRHLLTELALIVDRLQREEVDWPQGVQHT